MKYMTFAGMTYMFVEGAVNFEEASSGAASVGGNLLTIQNAEENAFIYNWLSTFYRPAGPAYYEGSIWLGISDASSEGTWVYTSGSLAGQPATFLPWRSGEPNNYNDEDYGTLNLFDGGWNDLDTLEPEYIRGYVVEIPANYNIISDQFAAEDALFSFTIPADTFTYQDMNETLSYVATLADDSDLPPWLSFNPNTRTFSGMPDDADVGTISVKLTVSSNPATSVIDTFDITVTNVNDAPTFDHPIADKAATADKAFTFPVPANTFSDEDVGDMLFYSASLANGDQLPPWLHFDDFTETFSGTPSNADVGTIDVRMAATDNHGASVSDEFTITVGKHLVGGNGGQTQNGTDWNDWLEGGNGKDSLSGSAGDDIMSGGNSADTMNGGAGDDIMSGGWGPDRFVFNAGFGDDIITDFAKSDLIQFVGVPGVLSIDDLSITQSSGDTIIRTDSGQITLEDFTGKLGANDFSFA